MKRAGVLVAIVLVLFATFLPSPAAAGGGWHHGHRGGSFWPGVVIGGIVAGAVTLATAPLWAFAPPPEPVVIQAPPPAVYVQPTTYAPRALPVPPPDSAPPPRTAQQPPAYAAPAVHREVVYDSGRYVLYGDGVRQPWQWVWVPAVAPPPPPPAPR